MKTYKYPVVLTIAGSDSGGGAGIQADLKTFSALGCFGTSAITAITAQNTMGVSGIHSIPATMVQQQIAAVMTDLEPAAIKIGMIHTAELAEAVASSLRNHPSVPVILDPVMVATSGARLIEEATVETLKQTLFPLATLVTPNLDEAVVLSKCAIRDVPEMKVAAREILENECGAVLLKGGHLKGAKVYDVFLDQQGKEQVFESIFIESNNLHGTGCTLSSAIAAYMALGEPLQAAIAQARLYVFQAIKMGRNVQVGKGSGPLNHFFHPQALQKYALE